MHDATRHDERDGHDGHDATAAGLVVSVADAAEALGISPGAVRKRIERGQLAGHKDAGQWRVVLDATDATRRDATNATPPVVSPAARSQLEAIRDEWLRPLVEDLNEAHRTIGRLEAERDRLQRDLDALRTQPEAPGATETPAPPTGTSTPWRER